MDQCFGAAFATCSVLLLVLAFWQMRSQAPKHKRYENLLLGAWALAGGAMSNLIPKGFHSIAGQASFFTAGILLAGWAFYGDLMAKRNAGK